MSERQILNIIKDLGKLVMKEKDPRNHRRTLYRVNPNSAKDTNYTLIDLNNEKANNSLDGNTPTLLINRKEIPSHKPQTITTKTAKILRFTPYFSFSGSKSHISPKLAFRCVPLRYDVFL